jgi:hypothetical protein
MDTLTLAVAVRPAPLVLPTSADGSALMATHYKLSR